MVLVVSCLALLVLIIAGFGILVGRGVSHGLTSRPQQSASAPFLDQLLLVFHYPPRSSGALLAGSLPLRYCSAKFASRTPLWALPIPGHVAGLVTDGVRAAQIGEAAVVSRAVDFVDASGSGRKRLRLNRKKTPAHLVGHCVHARPRVWRRLHFSGITGFSAVGHLGVSDVDCKRRRCNRHGDDDSPVLPRTGVG